MEVLADIDDLRAAVARFRAAQEPIALVPTMGRLHGGHAALARAALGHGNRVVVSLLQAPETTGEGQDFPAPEPPENLLRERPDIVFAPPIGRIYPAAIATQVQVARYTEVLCAAGRPGHFDEAMRGLLKMINIAGPDKVYFGQREWQQFLLARALVEDLNVPVDVVSCPVAREGDGLAMATQNANLTAQARTVAPQLFAEITQAAERIAVGEPSELACVEASENLIIAGFSQVEYLECRHAKTLRIAPAPGQGARVFAAAYLGPVRLIDNVPVPRSGGI